MVVQNLKQNVATSKQLLRRVIPSLSGERDCVCASALKDAIITPAAQIKEEHRQRLAPIVGRYLNNPL
jgi:5'-methylthioadenosine phosphorylase